MDEEIKFNSLIPELSVSNIDNSKKFYENLGFSSETKKACDMRI